MATWGRFPRRPRSKPPRKVDGGIVARTRRGAIGETWWSARFVAVLESFAIGSRLTRGRRYARGGQVLDLRVEPGLVSARVQGSRREPYAVRIGVKTLPARAWERIEDALAAQALFAARLLAGEMPHEIEEAFSTLDLSLFPARARELETHCSCPDVANPCKHIAATFYILAEAFDDDPFLIFAWRGRTRDQLIANLRTLRGEAAAATTERPHAPGAETVPPLAALAGDFWRIDSSFSGLHVAPHASDSPDALLRQLGPPPPEAGGHQLLERLASAYHAMAAGAERLAYMEALDADAPDEGAGATAVGPAAATPGRAPRFFVTDMRDFDSEDGDELPPPARRLYEFFSSIVKTATSIPPGEQLRTPLKCRRRLGRSPCHGRLIVQLIEAPPEIQWTCAACGEGGVLHGWECSIHDLGGRLPPEDRSHGPRIEATLSDEQYRVLEELDPIDILAEQLIRGALYDSGTIRLTGTIEEFDALSAELSIALDTAPDSSRRARLRRLQRLLAL